MFDEQSIFIFGAGLIGLITSFLALFGRGLGGGYWAFGWAGLYLSGALRVFPEQGDVLVDPASTAAGTLLPVMMIFGAWQFMCPSKPRPRILSIALLSAIPIRMVVCAYVPIATNRMIYAALLALCVAYCCLLFVREGGAQQRSAAVPLVFMFPLFGVTSLIDAIALQSGTQNPGSLLANVVVGAAVAGVQVSAFVGYRRSHQSELHTELASHYRAITHDSSDLFAEVGEDGTILYVNPAHMTVLGVDPKDVIGQPGSSIELTPVPMGPSSLGETGASPAESVFVAYHKKSGHPITLECRFHEVKHASGETRMVVVSRDITARAAQARAAEELNAQLEALVDSRTEELRRSAEKLEAANRLASLGTMAAGVAHQINNPIGSIRMSAEFALGAQQGDSDRDEAWRDALENAVVQSERCGEIVSSMLQFARNEPTQKRVEDLCVIVQRTCEQTEGYAASLDCKLVTRGLDRQAHIIGSAIELEQVFVNLIRNACEASRGPQVVTISASREAEGVVIEVRDEGVGIPTEIMDEILDPFFTTRLKQGGTGLGLSVAHGVIADHGGSIDIESVPGEGTKVRVGFPLAKDPQPARAH
ncbi:MAG: ATP-binding protein [Myxococcota bacterium]